MTYTKDEIECYTNILKNLNDGLNIYIPILDNLPRKKPEKASCKNCGNKHFFKDNGLLICNKCFCVITRCFIKDYNSKDRCHFQKKSIYNRSYHIDNRLVEITKKYDLDIKPEVYFKLKEDLRNLDRKINKINQEHERKRMINISYIIKKFLKKYDKQEAKKILNIGDDTKHEYDVWFKTFQSTNLDYSFMKKPIYNTCHESKTR